MFFRSIPGSPSMCCPGRVPVPALPSQCVSPCRNRTAFNALCTTFGIWGVFFLLWSIFEIFFPFYPWGNTQGHCAFQGVSTQPLKFRTLFFFSILNIINEQILVGKILRATKHVGTALASVNSVKYTAQIYVKEIMVITRHAQFAVSGQGSPQQQHCPRQTLGTISGFYNQH